MKRDEFKREKQYFVSLLLLRRMLRRGLIKPDEYAPLRELLQKKYQPLFGDLFK